MGQAASVVKKAVGDGSEDKKAMDDALNGLRAMADARMAKFYEDMQTGIGEPKLLQMLHITGKFYFFQAKASTDAEKLKGEVKTLIGDLAGGHWADAISDAATDVIGGLLADSSASVEERQTYSITMDDLGGIARLDALYLAYTFKSQSLVTNAQNMVACMVIKSSVDAKNMDDNTLRIIVNDSFPQATPASKASVYESLAACLLNPPPTEQQIAATKALEQFWQSQPLPIQPAPAHS